MGKGKTQQGSSEQLKTLRTLCHCLVSPHCSASAAQNPTKPLQSIPFTTKRSKLCIIPHHWMCKAGKYLWTGQRAWGVLCRHLALQQRTRKPLNRRCNTPSLPPERSFAELKTLFDIDLLCMRRDDERILQVEQGCAGADYLISLSNWPESCSFSLAQLGYLNLISVYKSIWGFVFILVCWECWGKRESKIHNSLNLTDDGNEKWETCSFVWIPCEYRNKSILVKKGGGKRTETFFQERWSSVSLVR